MDPDWSFLADEGCYDLGMDFASSDGRMISATTLWEAAFSTFAATGTANYEPLNRKQMLASSALFLRGNGIENAPYLEHRLRIKGMDSAAAQDLMAQIPRYLIASSVSKLPTTSEIDSQGDVVFVRDAF